MNPARIDRWNRLFRKLGDVLSDMALLGVLLLVAWFILAPLLAHLGSFAMP